jgi:glycerol kinase
MSIRAEKYILALDQGTTSSRAIIFNKTGNVIACRQEAIRQIYPKPGWVEHDPYEIWETQLSTARDAIKQAQIAVDQIEAIGLSNQRETTILWEKDTGKPVYNAIVWQCRRSAYICHDLSSAGLAIWIKEKTGLIIDAYFSGTKIMWVFDELSGMRSRAERGEILFGTVDTWLLYNLTGRHVTDPTNAARTMLFNIHECEWDQEILKRLRIPDSILPDISPNSSFFGNTKKDLFGVEIPVTGSAGDQQAALFGHACFAPGTAKNTYGTGCFALLNTGREPIASKNNLLTTLAWDLGKGSYTYALEGSVFIGGAVVQWLRDQLGLISNAGETDEIASGIDDTNGVFIVPAFVGLGAPYWDSDVRGTIVGLTRGANKAHLIRAALESIAYQSCELLEAMERDYGNVLKSIKADGGAAGNSFLMQFQADILNRRVILPEGNEITALGAAYFAGLHTGYWTDLSDIERNWRKRREYEPKMPAERRNELLLAWNKAVETARKFK